MYIGTYSSPLGEITLASNGHALTGLWFVGQKYYADILDRDCTQKLSLEFRQNDDFSGKSSLNCQLNNDSPDESVFAFRKNDDCAEESPAIQQHDGGSEKALQIFQQTTDWLDIYFSGKEPDFMPEISLSGSSFQLEVWEILRTIPYGQTITYGEIAAQIAGRRGIARMSAQAVGGAVGRNPVSILVPCHRVVGAKGNLTGYAGGISKKTSLLKLEGVDMASLFSPRHGRRKEDV